MYYFRYQWGLFLIFTLIHLLANYYAVTSLVFTNLNNTRLVLVLKTYLKFGGVSNPINLSKKEPVLLGIEPKSIEINLFICYVLINLFQLEIFAVST